MTTAQSPDNAFLVLDRPRVLGATLPVVDAEIGVSLVIYDLVIDGLGATVNVDPPLSGTVDPGDVIELWLEGDTTFLDSEIITDVNAITTLRIPKGRLQTDRFNLLFYTILRGSQNIGTSLSLIMLYNKIRPGLKDTRPEIDGHSELALLLPDEIRNGVGADFVSAQVCVSYPYCRAHDTITLKCNGEIMTHQVRADEAPQPPNPGSPNPITACFTVTRAYLERAIRPGGKLDFSYTVTDQLGNTPDTDAVWSASQTVDEDLAGTHLKAPILLERMEDYPGDDSTLIELEKLAGGPLLVIVITTDHRFLPGDTIEATYTAKVPGQPVDVVVPVSGVVEADPFGQKKPCILQVPNDKVIAQSVVTMVYTLKRGGAVIATSATAVARVIGESPITLDTPVPAANPVDPLAYPQGVTVQVTYAASLPGDQASLVLLNAVPGEPLFPVLPLDSNHRATFTLDASFLGAWHGKVPQLRWELVRGGQSIAQSLPLMLTVNRILDGDARLPRPVIAGQTGLELDVMKLVATDTLSVAQWLLQVAGQFVWLRYDGFDQQGSPVNFVRQGQAHQSASGFTTLAPVEWLKALGSGTEVTVTFKVNFAKQADEGAAVTFLLRSYRVTAHPALVVDTTPLVLRGENISIVGTSLPWVPTGDYPADTFERRFASGGVPPITFESSNVQIASVDRNSGMIRSEGNGIATITVSDSAGQTREILVTCFNVTQYIYNPTPLTWNAYESWRTSQGASWPINNDLLVHDRLLNMKYTLTVTQNYWSGPREVIHPYRGSVAGYWLETRRWEGYYKAEIDRTFPGLAYI
ncbi:hypothetical protein [Pseudomonas mandelii]|uniref:hypothetical protein n=1 Tax=Pseudomonas mandelii TaxID=75612 RepID=UPI003C75A083